MRERHKNSVGSSIMEEDARTRSSIGGDICEENSAVGCGCDTSCVSPAHSCGCEDLDFNGNPPKPKPVPKPPIATKDYVQDPNYVHTDNNFTDEYKEKLEGIEEGAEVNVQADWTVTDINSDAYIKHKPKHLVEDPDYVHTNNNFTDEYKDKIDSLVDNAQSDWTETDINSPTYIKHKPEHLVQDADYVHTDNNFTDEDVEKLAGIESGAEVNVQSDWNQTNSSADDYIKNKPNIVKNIKDNFVAGITQIEVPFKSSEFGGYPLLRAYNNWSLELIGETSYMNYSDTYGNDRKAIMKFYSNGSQVNVQENGFYVLGA